MRKGCAPHDQHFLFRGIFLMDRLLRRRALVLMAVLSLLALGVAGCGDDNEPKPDNSAAGGFTAEAGKVRDPADVAEEKENFENPPPVQLLSNNSTGIKVSKPKVEVIRTKKDFNALTKEHFARGIDEQTVIPPNFKDRMAVAVILPKSEPGTLVQIGDIQEKDGKVVVKAVEVVPGKGCSDGKGKGMTFRPINIVETAMMEGEAKLELETQAGTDC